MTTQKTLEQQIEELKAKHQLEESTKANLPGLSCFAIFSTYPAQGTTISLHVNLRGTPKEAIQAGIEQVLAAYPPSRNNTIAPNGRIEKETASPFILNWSNGVRDKEATINYICGETAVRVRVPQDYYSPEVRTGFHRGVNDTEYHYFPATSQDALNRMQVACQCLKGFEEIRYYGGHVASFTTKEDQKELFEKIVITGNK